MTSRELIKKSSLKATSTRVALLDTLHEAGHPMTALELRSNIKNIDLVTVYRGLRSFLQHGLVREVHLKNGPARYESAESQHHHHLVCTGCGVIDELPSCEVSELESQALKHSKRFTSISEHSLEFFGSCRACSRAV